MRKRECVLFRIRALQLIMGPSEPGMLCGVGLRFYGQNKLERHCGRSKGEKHGHKGPPVYLARKEKRTRRSGTTLGGKKQDLKVRHYTWSQEKRTLKPATIWRVTNRIWYGARSH